MSTPPRIACEITDYQNKRLKEMLEYGETKKVLSSMIDSLIKAYDKFGKVAVYALITGDLDMFDFSQLKPAKREKADGTDNLTE